MNKNFFEELLNKKKITRYKLCKITGISSGGLTDLLNKKVKNPRIDTLLKIAKALDLNEQEFAELCGYKIDEQLCIPLDIKDENDTHYGGNSLYGKWITGTCPKCKQDVQLGMNYCHNCGQKLLWENLENEKSWI
ncbi:helix-turn-helix domain-containing protein [Faecalibacillus intestinalis]|uniref:helix-turn-helix domain-containing protein n=1 Tax=Faecalibacillus intestinalis TaxID=1982626 RepID=UPI0022E76628|nr:helix-turn-helix domain-containing protein [Faecalibacillus intestinalis]